MKTQLKKGTRLWIGNAPVVLAADTEVDFETVQSVDHLAETLAANVHDYALNLASLAHEEEGQDDEGNAITIHVSYGNGGARKESRTEEVKTLAAVQAASVAAADAKAKADAEEALFAEELQQEQAAEALRQIEEAQARGEEEARLQAEEKARQDAQAEEDRLQAEADAAQKAKEEDDKSPVN